MGKILILTVLSIALVGCQSTSYYTAPNGQRYHQGDQWTMYRFDKNYNPQKVTP